MKLFKNITDILRCPECNGKIKYQNNESIVCSKCKREYKFKKNILIMLPSEKDNVINPTYTHLMKATQNHYSKDTFDINISERINYYLSTKLLFGRMIKSFKYKKDKFGIICDIGCGVGTLLKIAKNALSPSISIGIDISYNTLTNIRDNNIILINGTNLRIPLNSNISDLTISNGVIHHTPSPKDSFDELVRITKINGFIYLSVYNKSLYTILYNSFGKFCKFLSKSRLSLFIKIFFLPPYYLLYTLGILLKCKKLKLLNLKMIWNIFSDQFLTPQATFHTKNEILNWAKVKNLKLVDFQKRNLRMMLDFLFIKEQ